MSRMVPQAEKASFPATPSGPEAEEPAQSVGKCADPNDSGNLDSQATANGKVPKEGWLELTSTAAISAILEELAILPPGETIHTVRRAGDGNMNFVAHVAWGSGSVVLKQARPWVQRFPTVAAPVARSGCELTFYQTAGKHPALAGRMPRLLAACPQRHLLVLEDLTPATDCTVCYLSPEAYPWAVMAGQLVPWLAELHRTFPLSEVPPLPNQELLALQFHHVFVVPHGPKGDWLDQVTPGLSSLAKATLARLSGSKWLTWLQECYLARRSCLVHGDFFPGSWLNVGGQLYVIDPEFCRASLPELDLATMAAHARLCDPQFDGCQLVSALYEQQGLPVDHALLQGWCAVEILRRLLGLAQLPLRLNLQEKRECLDWVTKVLAD